MKLAISGETLGSVKELDEILKIFKKYGVKAIEMWPENIPAQEGKELVHKRLYANRDIARAKAIVEANGMETACVCFGAGFDKALAEDVELYAQELKRAVYVAKELGAKVVNHYCYYVCMEEEFPIERMRQYYGPALKAAEENGITLVLENEAHDVTKKPVKMLELVRNMNSPAFKTNYDATNYYQAGFEGFPYVYELLKSEIAHVHIKNGCIYHPEFGHRKESLGGYMTGLLAGEEIYYPFAGDGSVNIHGLLRRLKADGYNGYCSLEPHTDPELCEKYYREETEYLYETGYFSPY